MTGCLQINLILGEGCRVFAEAEARQPFGNIHRQFLAGRGETTVARWGRSAEPLPLTGLSGSNSKTFHFSYWHFCDMASYETKDRFQLESGHGRPSANWPVYEYTP